MDVVHQEIVTIIVRGEVVDRNSRLVVVLLTDDREHYLMPSRPFWQGSRKELPDIGPFASLVSSLYIEAEYRQVSSHIGGARIAYPCAEIHLLSGTYLGIRSYGSHESRCYCSIGIETIAVGCSAMLLCLRPTLIHSIEDCIFSVIRESLLSCSLIRRSIVCRIGIAISGFLPR